MSLPHSLCRNVWWTNLNKLLSKGCFSAPRFILLRILQGKVVFKPRQLILSEADFQWDLPRMAPLSANETSREWQDQVHVRGLSLTSAPLGSSQHPFYLLSLGPVRSTSSGLRNLFPPLNSYRHRYNSSSQHFSPRLLYDAPSHSHYLPSLLHPICLLVHKWKSGAKMHSPIHAFDKYLLSTY